MSEETVDVHDSIKEWLESLAGSIIDAEGAFCTNYAVVAEYMNAKGEWFTFMVKDETVPVWRTRGLLQHVMDDDLTVKTIDTDFEDGDL